MSKLQNLKNDLKKYQRPDSAKVLQRFFKTGSGEYGEGDVFWGLNTGETRSVAKKYLDLDLSDAAKLLASKIHEQRSVALMILKHQFEKGDFEKKKKIYQFYLKNISGINNWDLVDCSAPEIMSAYLYFSGASRKALYRFAQSDNLWKRRISTMATFYFIRKKEFKDALKIAKILLNDKEDLIHKAVGWMLREIGNRDLAVEERFLKKHYQKMPRTMLRYAIEKFPEDKRQAYLKGKI